MFVLALIRLMHASPDRPLRQLSMSSLIRWNPRASQSVTRRIPDVVGCSLHLIAFEFRSWNTIISTNLSSHRHISFTGTKSSVATFSWTISWRLHAGARRLTGGLCRFCCLIRHVTAANGIWSRIWLRSMVWCRKKTSQRAIAAKRVYDWMRCWRVR